MIYTLKKSVDEFVISMPKDQVVNLKKIYGKSQGILEFGSGGSSCFAAKINAPIICVETDRVYLDNLINCITKEYPDASVLPLYIDIGPTKEWGHPANKEQSFKFPDYVFKPWAHITHTGSFIDTVLIDGRFRVMTFFSCVLFAQNDMTIIWDDYTIRPEYHVVENVIKPDYYLGQQAVFNITKDDAQKVNLLEIYNYMFDSR